jgi:hypothetical protein
MKWLWYVLSAASIAAGMAVLGYGMMRPEPANPGASDENLAVVGFLCVALGGLFLLVATQFKSREQPS